MPPAQVSMRFPFTDATSGATCTLVVPPPGGTPSPGGRRAPGIAHPDCLILADLSPAVDAFFCPRCGWNGRVSGAWCMDVIAVAWPAAGADRGTERTAEAGRLAAAIYRQWWRIRRNRRLRARLRAMVAEDDRGWPGRST